MADPLPTLPDDLLSSSLLLAARGQILEWVTSHLEGIVETVRPHAGPLSVTAMREQGISTPAVLVSFSSVRSTRISGGQSVQASPTWMLYVVTSGNILDRTDSGVAISEALTRLVMRCPWFAEDDDDAGPFSVAPELPIDVVALYRDHDEKDAISIWAVRWTQGVDLGSAGKMPSLLEELRTIRGTVSTGDDENANAGVLIGDS